MLYSKVNYTLYVLFYLSITTSYANDDAIKNNLPINVENESGFSVYGNWCGPNHPKDIKNADNPIDILDKQCKTHDLCYANKGDYDCSCDREMVLDIDKSQLDKIYTAKQYLLAQNIKLHFAISPCNGEVENNKILPTRILTNIYKKTKDRAKNIINRFSW